jgi:hypothetical protein
MIDVEILAHSVGPLGRGAQEIATYRLVYPKQVHQEHLRHRAMSFSVSSGRAVPTKKQLQAVRENPAMPAYWGREQKGMSPGEPFSAQEIEAIERIVLKGQEAALSVAEALADIGVHKSLVGRYVYPWAHYEMVCTSCWPGLANFFALRISPKADPTMRRIAVQMADAFRYHQPRELKPGEWHLPFLSPQEQLALHDAFACGPESLLKDLEHKFIRLSVARTGRVSYLQHGLREDQQDIEKDLRWFDQRLADGDWSVFEHAARVPWPGEDISKLQGNLVNFVQLRQTLPRNVHTDFDFSLLDRPEYAADLADS